MVEQLPDGVYEDSLYDKNVYIQLDNAEKRSACIVQNSTSYDVELNLPKGDYYTGNVSIEFELK